VMMCAVKTLRVNEKTLSITTPSRRPASVRDRGMKHRSERHDGEEIASDISEA
jgi:hypothetical protein